MVAYISPQGLMVGASYDYNVTGTARVWIKTTDGQVRDLGQFGGAYTTPTAVSPDGTIVGSVYDMLGGTYSYALIVPGSYTNMPTASFGQNGILTETDWNRFNDANKWPWDLGRFGKFAAGSDCVNDIGQVFGDYWPTSDTTVYYPFLWNNGTFTQMPASLIPAGSTAVSPNGCNNAGLAVGYYETAGHYYGFVWDTWNNTFTGVSPTGSNTDLLLFRVNDSGLAVGGFGLGDGVGDAVTYSTSTRTLTDVGTPAGATGALFNSVTANGMVSGTATFGGGVNHAVLWKNGVWTDLGASAGVPSATASLGTGISRNGVYVVGYAEVAGGEHAFLYNTLTATTTDIGNGAGAYTEAMSVNDSGVVVGIGYPDSSFDTSPINGFVYFNGQFANIGKLGAGLGLYQFHISETGLIVGQTGNPDSSGDLVYYQSNYFAQPTASATTRGPLSASDWSTFDNGVVPTQTVASHTAGTILYQHVIMTDASNATDCTAGSGTAKSECMWNGSAWQKP